MSRVSAKRIAVVILAGLALATAFGVAALQVGDSLLSRLLGIQALEWAVPLAAGAVVGISAWVLLDGTVPTLSDPPLEEIACPSCGRTILRDWRLCPHCGAFVGADVEAACDAEAR